MVGVRAGAEGWRRQNLATSCNLTQPRTPPHPLAPLCSTSLTLAGAAAHLLGQRVAQRVQLRGALVRQELVQGRVQQADGHCGG